MTKYPVSELLRLACIYAERDQEELLLAWDGVNDEGGREMKKEIRDFLKALRAYRQKRWGRTQLEANLSKATPRPVEEIIKRLDARE